MLLYVLPYSGIRWRRYVRARLNVAVPNVAALRQRNQQLPRAFDEPLLFDGRQVRQLLGPPREIGLRLLPALEVHEHEQRERRYRHQDGGRKNAQTEAGMPDPLKGHRVDAHLIG